MAINRIGSLNILRSSQRDIANVQGQLGTLQQQISSGNKASNFTGLNGQVERFTLLDAKMRAAKQYRENNDVNLARMQTADTIAEQMIGITDSMESLIVTARGPTGQSLNFREQMQYFMQALGDQLNSTFEGRYLFGGTSTNMPPVPNVMSPSIEEGEPDNAYYAGAEQNLVYRADERIEFEFPMRADNPAFQKIFAAAKQAISAYASGDDAALGEALSLLQDGKKDLVATRTVLNTTILNVKAVNESLDALQLYWKGVSEEITKTDLVAASTQVAAYEALLQATFQVYARLSQLRLSDYLK